MADADPAPARPRLYLVLRVQEQAADAAALAAAAQTSGTLATALLEPDPLRRPSPSDLAAAVAAIQKLGVATLVSGDPGLARTVKADGVHLPPSKTLASQFSEAHDILGTRYIVGADAGRSKHDAMTLGEAGAEYVGFGIPPHVEDRETARERRLDLTAWWSEIFEVPCVAFDVETPDDAGALADAGADFIALRLPEGLSPGAVSGYLHPFLPYLDTGATE